MPHFNIDITADNPRMPRASELAMMLITSSLRADELESSGRSVFNEVMSECATESLGDPEFQACLLVSLIRILNVIADLAGKEMGITADDVIRIAAPILAAMNYPPPSDGELSG